MFHEQTWTGERVTKLSLLIDAGYSAGQAAAAMGCTRNAIIGIAHRKHLQLHGQGSPRLERPKIVKARRRATERACCKPVSE